MFSRLSLPATKQGNTSITKHWSVSLAPNIATLAKVDRIAPDAYKATTYLVQIQRQNVYRIAQLMSQGRVIGPTTRQVNAKNAPPIVSCAMIKGNVCNVMSSLYCSQTGNALARTARLCSFTLRLTRVSSRYTTWDGISKNTLSSSIKISQSLAKNSFPSISPPLQKQSLQIFWNLIHYNVMQPENRKPLGSPMSASTSWIWQMSSKRLSRGN